MDGGEKDVSSPGTTACLWEGCEHVNLFKYLGSWLNAREDSNEEILTRIEIARKTFISWKPVMCNIIISMHLRKKILKCYVWSTLLYACETSTLKAASINKLQAFEFMVLPSTPEDTLDYTHTSNEDVLIMIDAERELLGPKYHLFQLIIQGKVEEKRWIGLKKLSLMCNMRL
ncbi:hypothetical protein HUJ05_001898 [Dendroctonus ponderosae]|nr:hypothetical protein HUJ05_001898 [Dendroctonus ponderosae]